MNKIDRKGKIVALVAMALAICDWMVFRHEQSSVGCAVQGHCPNVLWALGLTFVHVFVMTGLMLEEPKK